MERTEQIQGRVLELLGGKIGAGRPISLDSVVVEDTGLDSVSVMDFVMELEDEFDVTIPLDQLAEVRTVRDLADTVIAVSNGRTTAQRG
jgi:acyl carrier protein